MICSVPICNVLYGFVFSWIFARETVRNIWEIEIKLMIFITYIHV